jgi:zinc-ribbon domain
VFCSECGAQNPDTNQFCRNCGKPLLHRQPTAQPAMQPAAVPGTPVPQAAVPGAPVLQPVTAAAPAPTLAPAPGAAPKRKRNWLGLLSLLLGILSWGILTVIVATVAVLLGLISLFLFRRATGRIGISSILGILLGIAAVAAIIVLA